MSDTTGIREFTADEIREVLAGVLREIADATSLETALKFVRAFGGQRLHMPLKPTLDHKIAQKIGMKDAQELASLFGACDIYVPKMEALTKTLRDRRIRAAFDNGASVNDLANQFNLSNRRITAVLNSSEGD